MFLEQTIIDDIEFNLKMYSVNILLILYFRFLNKFVKKDY